MNLFRLFILCLWRVVYHYMLSNSHFLCHWKDLQAPPKDSNIGEISKTGDATQYWVFSVGLQNQVWWPSSWILLRVASEWRMLALLHWKTSEVCWKVTKLETPEKKTETLYFMSHLLPYGGGGKAFLLSREHVFSFNPNSCVFQNHSALWHLSLVLPCLRKPQTT